MTTIDILKKSYGMLSVAHKRQLCWTGVVILVVSFFEIALAGVISLLGIALAAPHNLETLPYVGTFFAEYAKLSSAPPVVSMLVAVLCLVAVATLCKNVSTAYMTYKQHHISQIIAWDVGLYTFNRYLHAPYLWYSQQNLGELGVFLQWRAYVSEVWIGSLMALAQMCIMVLLLISSFVIAPAPSLLLFGVCGTIAAFVYRLTQKRVRNLSHEDARLSVESGKVTHYALQGMREVHIYNQREAFYNQYAKFAPSLALLRTMQRFFIPLPQWVLESAGLILLLASVVFMYWQGESVPTITGVLTLLAGVSWRLLPAMNKLVSSTLQARGGYASAAKLLQQCLDTPQEEVIKQSYPLQNSLELKGVSFVYPEATKAALKDINIVIPKGNIVGFVGLSGAGKSTLVSVLTGLLAPHQGHILVDGLKVTASPGFLNLGYVPQSPYIMDASLAENIAFSHWGKEVDEARVLECCQQAAITFLDELPQGVHTRLGDRGVRLSGGQIQRVSIARALYDDPDILLFDEATSALDGAAEAAIQKTILALRKKLTVVIVAHRLTTVEGCDKVYWIHEGELRQVDADAEALDEYKKFLEQESE